MDHNQHASGDPVAVVEQQQVVIYSRQECLFYRCPRPEICRRADTCITPEAAFKPDAENAA